jgi:hypothetical protein
MLKGGSGSVLPPPSSRLNCCGSSSMVFFVKDECDRAIFIN